MIDVIGDRAGEILFLHVDVDTTPALREGDGVAHQRLAALDVRRVQPAGIDLELVATEQLLEALHPALARADVEVRETGLLAEVSSHARVDDELCELADRRLRGALVGDRHLARTDDLVDEHHVLAHGRHDGDGRHVVATGPQIRGESLLAQRLRLREQSRHRLHRRVDAERADHRRDAGAHDLGEMNLRRLRGEPFLTAAAEQVLVWIDEAGTDVALARVDDVHVDAERLHHVAIDVAHQADLAIHQQDRLLSQVLRGVNVAMLDEGQHVRGERKGFAVERR